MAIEPLSREEIRARRKEEKRRIKLGLPPATDVEMEDARKKNKAAKDVNEPDNTSSMML